MFMGSLACCQETSEMVITETSLLDRLSEKASKLVAVVPAEPMVKLVGGLLPVLR